MKINLENDFNNFMPENYKTELKAVSDAAEKYGAALYLIGGITRDILLKKPVKDIDITIEGDAVSFCRYLEKLSLCTVTAVNENLKTAKAEFKSGAVIDFASSRSEYYERAGLMPIAFNFGCPLEEDVKRRDFTINTLAISLAADEKYTLIDYFGGYEDIKNKKIRVLHEKSFKDDPSRIIRALKFQARLGFEIEEKTAALMAQYLENSDKNIPLERIKSELKEYFSLKNDNLYRNIIETKVCRLISDNPFYDFNAARLKEMQKYFNSDMQHFIYTALLLVNTDFENQRLNLTSEEKKVLYAVKELCANSPLEDNLKIYKAFKEKSALIPVIYYIISGNKAVLKYFNELKNIKLLINGSDLINAGFKPSPLFGAALDAVLKAKLEGRLQSKEEELNYAEKFLKGE